MDDIPAKPVKVRRLGPADFEHEFWSTEPGNRICAACRRKIDEMHVSPMCDKPFKDHSGGD